MSREVTVTSSLNIRKIDADTVTILVQKAYQGSFVDDMTGAAGPTPGVITAAVRGSGGVQVTFSALARPTWAWIEHLGRTDGSAAVAGDYVDIGIYDPVTHKFYPLCEWLPGMKDKLRFSRNLQETFLGPGTGSAGLGETSRLMCIGYPVSQKLSIEAYEY